MRSAALAPDRGKRLNCAADVVRVLGTCRLPLADEMQTHRAIAVALDAAGIRYEREVRLDARSRVDFIIDTGIALEVKIKGSATAIYRQCERYAAFPIVREIVLATNRSMGMPSEINGKSMYVLKLGRAWL